MSEKIFQHIVLVRPAGGGRHFSVETAYFDRLWGKGCANGRLWGVVAGRADSPNHSHAHVWLYGVPYINADTCSIFFFIRISKISLVSLGYQNQTVEHNVLKLEFNSSSFLLTTRSCKAILLISHE